MSNLKAICGNFQKLSDSVNWAIWENDRQPLKTPYERLTTIEKAVYQMIEAEAICMAERLQAHRVLAWVNQAQIVALEEQVNEDLNGDGVIGRKK